MSSLAHDEIAAQKVCTVISFWKDHGMNAVRSKTLSRSVSRRGLIAISEMLVMVVALVGLFWLGSQLVASATSVPASAA